MIKIFIKNIRFFKLKKRISKSINLTGKFKVKSMKFISYNGRTCSFSFTDKKSNKEFFIKYFFNSSQKKCLISESINQKYELVKFLRSNELISYQPYKINKLQDIYLRDYIHGIVFSEFSKTLNSSDFEVKMLELLLYIDRILTCMSKHLFFNSLDIRLDNFIVSNTGTINIIDLDMSHANSTATNIFNTNTIDPSEFKAHTYAKFFEKTVVLLNRDKQIILFNLMKKKLENFKNIEDAILCRFFYSKLNKKFDRFILDNYLIFSKNVISFPEVNVKDKLTKTLAELAPESYLLARRYNWLIKDSEFNSKDIDIFCSEENVLDIIQTFKKNGWDIYNGKIKQFFEHCEMLVTIDLRSDMEERYGLTMASLMDRSENLNNVNIIGEADYHEIMMLNLFKFKKYLKVSYMNEFVNYCPVANPIFKEKYSYIMNYKFHLYEDKLFLSLFQKFRRVFGDFLHHKSVILLGADGAGKSTFSKLLYKNISLIFKCEIKYYGGFFYPSGRTNLFLLKTSVVFYFAKSIKDIIFNRKSKLSSKDLSVNIYKNNMSSGWRKLSVIKKPGIQILFICILPIFILDIWAHKIINRFTTSRLYICDRYYDDIVLNFTSTYVRKFIRQCLPSSDYSLYFYTTPDKHFMRKKNEDIEMIVHMQTCYSETNKYHLKLPTNAQKYFLGKKTVSMLLNNLS
jgi:hypothetical protein